jgi:KUP system potassium uptake protein
VPGDRPQPAILAALNPLNGLAFLHERGWQVFAAVGAIVLAFTGAEALYADMGHFGKKPIQLAWTGPGAAGAGHQLHGPGRAADARPVGLENPFYRLFPRLAVPAVVLATLATVIASQAVISGAYSMTRQAMQLGLLPRMTGAFTSAKRGRPDLHARGELAAAGGVLLAVLGFGSSSALASAYGIAVT